MSAMASQITSLTIVNQPFIQAQIKETSKPRVTSLCEGNSAAIPTQRASKAKLSPVDDVIMWFVSLRICMNTIITLIII